MSDPTPVPSALDPSRVPVHVAWVTGDGRAAGGGGTGAGGRAEDVAAASDAALADLVEGALSVGIRWLTVAGTAGSAVGEALATWPLRRGAEVPARVAVRRFGPDGVCDEHRADTPVLVVTLAVGYSGRAEVLRAVERLAAEGIAPKDVDETAIAGRLYDPSMPDPDLMVRSGGDRRLSDLLLWEMTYAELLFLDDPWPAIRRGHLYDAVVEFQRRDRRYGGIVSAGSRR